MWQTPDRTTPPGDPDYRNTAVRVDPRGLARRHGTLRFADLESLPRVSGTRFIARDGAYVDEDVETLRHRQVMLAWMMNDEPIPGRPRCAASPHHPLRSWAIGVRASRSV
jgi:hypothetical protein